MSDGLTGVGEGVGVVVLVVVDVDDARGLGAGGAVAAEGRVPVVDALVDDGDVVDAPVEPGVVLDGLSQAGVESPEAPGEGLGVDGGHEVAVFEGLEGGCAWGHGV